MAVKVTKSGGIIIQISGDNTELMKSLREAEDLSKKMGKSVAGALGAAYSPAWAADSLNSINKYLVNAAAAATAAKADLSNLKAEFEKMGRSIGVAEKNIANYVTMQNKMFQAKSNLSLENNLKGIQRLTAASTIDMARLRATIGDNSGALRAMGRAASESFGKIANLRNALIAGTAGVAIKNTGETAMQFDTYQRSFNAIAGSPEGGAEEMEFVRKEADRLGQSIFALMDSYRGLAAASTTSGLSQEQVRDIFSAVGEASTTLGLSSDQTKYALYALQQMMSKGVVSMEELRRQLGDQLPGAFSAAARAMNVTEAELIKLVESGQLLSRDFLPKFAAELRNTLGAGFADAANSARANFVRLGNAVTEMKKNVGDGFLVEAAEGSLRLAEILKDNEEWAKAAGEALGFAAKNADTLAFAIGGTLAGKAGRVLLDVGASAKAAAQGMIAEAESARVAAAAKAKDMEVNLAWARSEAAAAAARVHWRAENAVLAASERELDAIKKQLIIDTNALTAAEGRLAAVQKNALMPTALSGLKGAATGVMNLFGGPFGLAVTAGATAIYTLATAEDEAVKYAREHAEMLKLASQNANEAAEAMRAYAAQIENTSYEKLIFEQAQVKRSLQEILDPGASGDTLYKKMLEDMLPLINTNENRGRELAVQLKDAAKSIIGMDKELANIPLSHLEGLRDELMRIAAEFGRTEEAAEALQEIDSIISLRIQADELANSVSSIRFGVESLGDALRALPSMGEAIGSAGSLGRTTVDEILKVTGGDAVLSEMKRVEDFKKALEEMPRLHQLGLMNEEEYQAALEGIRNKNKPKGGGGGSRVNPIEKMAREAEKQQREMMQGFQEQLNFYEKLKDVVPQAGAEYEKFRAQITALQADEYSAMGIQQQFIDEWSRWEDLRNATDAFSGLQVAMRDFVGGMTEADVAANIFKLSADGITDMLTDTITFSKSAEQAIGDFATSMVNSLARIAVEMMVVKPITDGLIESFSNLGGGSFGDGLLGSIGGMIGSLFTGPTMGQTAISFIPGIASADGNIFNAEGLHKHVNSIVNRPTIFPFAKGVGLMGEAGAEAIMPLQRDSKGRLGVSASADGPDADAAPNISINIINQSGQNLSGQQGTMRQDENGNMSLDVIIKAVEGKIRGNMAKGTSPVGHGIEEQYGLKSTKAMNRLRRG